MVDRKALGPHPQPLSQGERGIGPHPGPLPRGRGESQWPIDEEKLVRKLSVPGQGRLYFIRYAFKMGWSIDRINELTRIDRWFLDQINQLVEFEDVLCSYERLEDVPREVLFQAKQVG